MPGEAVLRESALEWLRFADEDLQYAKAALESGQLSTGVACFHAQQAAEKSIKAVLVLDGADVPRTHDLERLGSLLQPTRIAGLPAEAIWLTPFAVTHRYPGEGEAPSREYLIKAVKLGNETMIWAKAMIG